MTYFMHHQERKKCCQLNLVLSFWFNRWREKKHKEKDVICGGESSETDVFKNLN